MVLTDLALDRNYEISVCAVNSQGAGPSGAPGVVWVGEAVPTAPPRDVAARALSPTEVALVWSPPTRAQQNGDLLGYKVCWTHHPQLQYVTSSLCANRYIRFVARYKANIETMVSFTRLPIVSLSLYYNYLYSNEIFPDILLGDRIT